MDISANGGRVRLFRDVGNVTMDLNSVERIQLNALGGPDNVVVNDLTGTGVTRVAIDLASPPGSGVGDGQADTVTVNGIHGNGSLQLQIGSGSADRRLLQRQNAAAVIDLNRLHGSELHIIHRDVSPQNILCSYDGEVKIIDFGIAKAANRSQ